MATRGGRKGGERGGQRGRRGGGGCCSPPTPSLQVLASIRKTICQSCTATANKVASFIERISTNETRALHNMLGLLFIYLLFIYCMATTSTPPYHLTPPFPRRRHLSPIAPTISISINQVIHKILGQLAFTEEPHALHQRSGSLFIVHAEPGDQIKWHIQYVSGATGQLLLHDTWRNG